MAAKQHILSPRYCIQHSRFTKLNGWRVYDLSVSLNGNIAVAGFNEYTNRTSIDVYSDSSSDLPDSPKLFFEKEFDKDTLRNDFTPYKMVSFVNNDILVFCLGDKLEVFQVNKNEVLQSQKLNGLATCFHVRGREIFIGFFESNIITVYDAAKLEKLKSIILKGIECGDCLVNITAQELFCFKSRPLFVTWSNNTTEVDKSAIFEEENGEILFQFEDPAGTHCYSWNADVSEYLGVAAVVYSSTFSETALGFNKVVFYLLNETFSSFLIVEVESGTYKIRISDRGDTMLTGNYETGEVKVYDMADVFTYDHFKDMLASTLRTDECARLATLLKLPNYPSGAILNSRKTTQLLLSLEEGSIIQPYDVDEIIAAFSELKINTFCRHVAEIYRKTRSPVYYKEVIKELDKEIKILRVTSEEERRKLQQTITEVENLYDEPRKLQDSHLKQSSQVLNPKALQETEELLENSTRENNKLKAELAQCRLRVSSLDKDLQVSKQVHEETKRSLQQTKELNQKMALARNKFEADRDEGQLQISTLREELAYSKRSKTETEKVLTKTEALLQKVIQEKNELKTELKQWQIQGSLESISLEEGTKSQSESGKKASTDITDGASLMVSPNKKKYPQKSLLGDEFSKLIVKLSTRLTRTNCVYLARYFNFSPAKIAIIQEESKTPGLYLFDTMKERNIIKMNNVSELQKALTDLELEEINETLVIPYHRKIDT